jgi:hypothetical protein
VDDRVAVLVEGPDDELFLGVHLGDVVFFPAGGRSNVVSAAVALRSWNVRRFSALVDVDYLGAPPLPVKHYEGRDLEGMLVKLGALETLLEHQGSREKLATLGGAQALVQRLVNEASFLSALREVNAREGLGLPFDSVDIFKKVDQATLSIKKRELCQALLSRSSSGYTPDDLMQLASAIEDDGIGPSGKDVAGLAGVALRKVAGSLPHAAADVRFLLPHLRSGSALLVSRSTWLANFSAELAAA